MKSPNGYGSVTKLSGSAKRRNPYGVRITTGWADDGTQRQKFIGYYPTKKAALEALAAYNEHPYDLDAHKTTFADLYKRWHDHAHLSKAGEHTYHAAYLRLSGLHDMPITDIRRRHIQGIIDDCPLGYSTKKNMKTLCNKLFVLAIDCELVTTNYATNVRLPPAVQSRKHHPFEADELATLWDNADDFRVRIILMYCYTGFRPTELLRVKTDNVHLDERIMYGGMKTAVGRNRAVPISKKILPFVKECMTAGNEYLIVSPVDNKPVLDYDRLKAHIWLPCDALKKLPRTHLPHDCRRTCATLLDNAGVNLKTMQLILGHSSQDITHKVYTHKTLEQLVAAIDLI
jgi:integrase